MRFLSVLGSDRFRASDMQRGFRRWSFHVLGSDRFRAGDMVEVRSRAEILATLDENGCIDGMPFMPEMLQFCGRRFKVAMLAHKTCDTIHYTGIRRLPDTVHLEGLRCDGASHGGCQANCLMFWKTAWLKPVNKGHDTGDRQQSRTTAAPARLTEQDLLARTQVTGGGTAIQYQCQVTEIPRATSAWAWWNPAQYIQDVTSGNWSLKHATVVLVLAGLRRTLPVVKGYRLQLGLYNWLARKTGRPPYHDIVEFRGPIPLGSPTPDSPDSLQRGDWVRIRPLKEISATLNIQGKNRGMFFDAELVPYCGGTYQVSGVVKQIIDEGTGRMMQMKTPCIALEGVYCRSEYSGKRLMCPRAIMPVWRPIWLEKVDQPSSPSVSQ